VGEDLVVGLISSVGCWLVRHVLGLCVVIKNKSMRAVRPKADTIWQVGSGCEKWSTTKIESFFGLFIMFFFNSVGLGAIWYLHKLKKKLKRKVVSICGRHLRLFSGACGAFQWPTPHFKTMFNVYYFPLHDCCYLFLGPHTKKIQKYCRKKNLLDFSSLKLNFLYQ